MDSIFQLENGARAAFLQNFVQSFGCTYICLWSYVLPSNGLISLISVDGFYNEKTNLQPSSSSGSHARRLFDEYRQLVPVVENDRVPGLAFKNGVPYMELQELDLQRLACIEIQLQFYQAARIKTVIFMGCMTGEIELGMSNDTQVNLEMELKNYFPEDFLRQAPPRELLLPTDLNRPSSSSSSLKSLSMDSPECSPFLFNPYLSEPPKEPPMQQALRPISTSISPLHEATQPFSLIQRIQFPTVPENKDSAITGATLTVQSSPSTSSSSHQPPLQNFIPNYPLSQKPSSAFKRYGLALAPSSSPLAARVRRQNLAKRSITFFRTLGLMRIQERVQGSRPTTTQLHHMIAERKRREKLNDSFQALRSLLPPGTKKDKASVLASTTEYLNSLKAQVAELTKKSQNLETQFLLNKKAAEAANVSSNGRLQVQVTEAAEAASVSSNERLQVQVTEAAESTSEARIVDVQVILRGECNVLDMVIRILELLKQAKSLSLMSVQGDTQVVDSNSINRVMLRLKIEDGEWDKSAFQEAVRRVVSDLA